MSETSRTPRETVEALLNTVTEEDRTKLADFYAPDVVIEMPFQPGAARTEGRETIRARMVAGKDTWVFDGVKNLTLHETADPEVIITEYELAGRVTATQKPFTVRFVMVTRVRDGLIVHSRDYNNPLTMARAMDATPEQLADMLAPESDAL
jgi:ketosteroid isomerase-like protein